MRVLALSAVGRAQVSRLPNSVCGPVCVSNDSPTNHTTSDILQVISGKETKLKGTKKDPNCGFCQNHGVKILRKGHVRSCGFGQERHFKRDNCFDCEVHYIRNEVNRLQIKMRRAMKEDKTLNEEQRKNAREAITRDEVEKGKRFCRMLICQLVTCELRLQDREAQKRVCLCLRTIINILLSVSELLCVCSSREQASQQQA